MPFFIHFSHINWPKSELIFNLLCLLSYLVAGVLESVHLWRWDYTNGSPINYAGPMRNQNRYGSAMYGGRSGYGGYQRGMGLNARMNFQAYCGRYPRDCQNYMAMLAGYNVYFGKSFAVDKYHFLQNLFRESHFRRCFSLDCILSLSCIYLVCLENVQGVPKEILETWNR